MQIFKTCFLSSQNYLCIGEHTLCPFFKARFFGFKLLIWMRLIIMS
ncbi:unknown [Alistipes putredinis CAG:67]|nr:unknown [Alistipes putredinis CAG:67]